MPEPPVPPTHTLTHTLMHTPLSGKRRQTLVQVARGKQPAELVIRNAQVVSTLTREVYRADVALHGGRIAGVGAGYRGEAVLDARGAYLSAGFLDGHIHIESSLLTPRQFARAVRPHGTTGVVAEPHETANVLGLAGVRWMLEAGQSSGLRVLGSMPSCVPASPFERGGAVLGPAEVQAGLALPGMLGLAEMMNYPGVLGGDPAVWAVLEAAQGAGRRDGHAAGVRGLELQGYAAAGLHSDHEATTPDEARERLRAGLWLMVREGSAARNLQALLPVLRAQPRRALLVSDDVSVDELLALGHLDRLLRACVAGGLHPLDALRLVTSNPAEYWGLHDLGAVAPGYHADLVLLDSLETFGVLESWVGGVRELPETPTPALPGGGVTLPAGWDSAPLEVPAHWPVIGVSGQQITTTRRPPGSGDTRLLVADRYGRDAQCVCWAAGLHITGGAVALSILHDAHNLLVAGDHDDDLRAAGRAVRDLGGGVAVVRGGELIARLPLPYGGLMTDLAPTEAAAALEAVRAALASLGCPLPYPVTTLSFLGLSVIPALKLTPDGLLDVTGWRYEV